MKAYVINVPESVDAPLSRMRRRHIQAELHRAGLSHRLVAAVDGLHLTPQERATMVDAEAVARYPQWLVPGVLGAALSHVQAYREVLEDDEPVALILEDDAVLGEGFAELVDRVCAHMQASEVVMLYWRTQPGCRFSSQGSVELGDGRRLMYPVEAGRVTCAAAYLITRAACESMVEALTPVRACTDNWDWFAEWGGFQSLRCAVPRPVGVRTDFKSTVDYHPVGSLSARVSQFVAHHRVFPLHQAFAWRRARGERRATRFEIVDEPSPFPLAARPTAGRP